MNNVKEIRMKINKKVIGEEFLESVEFERISKRIFKRFDKYYYYLDTKIIETPPTGHRSVLRVLEGDSIEDLIDCLIEINKNK